MVIKYVFFCLLMFFCVCAVAQPKKGSVVQLISSERSQGIKRNGANVIKVYRGAFQQDYSILRSDSAYFYPEINSFDAFGNVHIIQGDTLNIYSDKLNYNGNTHVALLTDNVRMVDKDATLSTNFLTYNTATRIGTYTGGGKLVNKQNTLTSKNGYYFAFTRDSYFRYDVVLNTVDAIIKNDTLRYNTGSRIAYFYGPTHIYGKKNKDTLYTENGTYNTVTEQAFFGKKNLYTQGTKSLKGDSLFYDRLKGFGRATKNVVFNDNEQKATLYGDLGLYYQKEERTVITRDPWVAMVTEQKDSTKTDSATKAVTPSVRKAAKKEEKAKSAVKSAVKDVKVAPAITDSLKTKLSADTVSRAKRDTIYMTADTLVTRVLSFKDLKDFLEERRKAMMIDTSAAGRAKKLAGKPSKFLSVVSAGVPLDTTYRHPNFFGPPKVVVQKVSSKKVAPKPREVKAITDSVYLSYHFNVPDTARVRVLFGYRNAKIFKSDFQGVADSIFYSSADSTIRFYINPIMWSQGSQLTGDTVYLQLKNKKLDNMDIFPKAFLVNTEKGDTTYFNQISGKKMKGYFTDSKLTKVFVDGNAETIYFNRDSATHNVTDMSRSLQSRIRVNLKDNKVQNILRTGKYDERAGPLKKFKEDERFLKGFIWKPRSRPESKEQIIAALDKKHKYHPLPGKAPVKPKPIVKSGDKVPPSGMPKPLLKDSTKTTVPILKADTAIKKPAPNTRVVKGTREVNQNN